MLKDFRSYFMRGNVLDLAVGVIISAAFGKLVTRVQKRPEAQAEVAKGRIGPFRISTIPREATRCAYCASTLSPVEVAPAA